MKIEQLRIGDKGPAGGIIFINPTTHGNKTGLWFEAGPQRLEYGNRKILLNPFLKINKKSYAHKLKSRKMQMRA